MSFQGDAFQNDAFQLFELVVIEWIHEAALAPGVWPNAAAIANPWMLATPALATWLEQSALSGIGYVEPDYVEDEYAEDGWNVSTEHVANWTF